MDMYPAQLLTRVRAVEGTPFSTIRPNDTTTYAIQDVWGAGADCRIALALPAMPADARDTSYLSLTMWGINRRGGADPAFSMILYAFNAQPATVIADNAPLTLSDADIAKLLPAANGGAPTDSWATGGGQGSLNFVAGANGRRAARASYQPGISQQNWITLDPETLPTLWVYFVMGTTYVPLALERMDWRVFWNYTATVNPWRS